MTVDEAKEITDTEQNRERKYSERRVKNVDSFRCADL